MIFGPSRLQFDRRFAEFHFAIDDSDIVLVPKTPIQQVDEIIEQYIIRGAYRVVPREFIWGLNSTSGSSL